MKKSTNRTKKSINKAPRPPWAGRWPTESKPVTHLHLSTKLTKPFGQWVLDVSATAPINGSIAFHLTKMAFAYNCKRKPNVSSVSKTLFGILQAREVVKWEHKG